MNLTHTDYDFEGGYTFDAKREARAVQSEIDDIEAILEDTEREADHATAEEDLKELRELLEELERIGDEHIFPTLPTALEAFRAATGRE